MRPSEQGKRQPAKKKTTSSAAKVTKPRAARKPKPPINVVPPHPKTSARTAPKQILIREKLVQAELAATKLGIHEEGGNNRGPWVKKFLAETGLPEGYAWCDGFQSYEMHLAAGHALPIESASVAQTVATARKLGWIVDRPLRGDLVCFDFDGDGQCDDHIGLIVKVLGLGTLLTLQTVEGNTSSGVAGSQSDGDGVFLRRRVVKRETVVFIRIPG